MVEYVEGEVFPKVRLSEYVGWSESTGRHWIKVFKDYIPYIKRENSILYNNESVKVLSYIKRLKDTGISKEKILQALKKYGTPHNDNEFNEIASALKESSFSRSKGLDGMKLPTQKEMIIPILKVLSDGKAYSAATISDKVASYFNLTEEQRVQTYLSGKDSIYVTTIRGARYSLIKEDYIEEVNKLTFQITQDGLELLRDNEEDVEDEIEELEKVINPLEVIQDQVSEIENELITKLIDQLKQAHWRRLEYIVVELLTAMGYGDGEVTDKTNDGGLDGIIKEDKLGLDNIYIQAKRWENTVGRPDVMSFSGALDAKSAKKGIFITTSSFTNGAKEYASRLESKKIILIDGYRLAKLMIENNIGVNVKRKIVIKEIDFSYFEGD